MIKTWAHNNDRLECLLYHVFWPSLIFVRVESIPMIGGSVFPMEVLSMVCFILVWYFGVRSCPSVASFKCFCYYCVGSWTCPQTWLEMSARDEHSSLLWTLINYRRKKFYTVWFRTETPILEKLQHAVDWWKNKAMPTDEVSLESAGLCPGANVTKLFLFVIYKFRSVC